MECRQGCKNLGLVVVSPAFPDFQVHGVHQVVFTSPSFPNCVSKHRFLFNNARVGAAVS